MTKKKTVRIGINGFGRIGRNIFRAWLNHTYLKHQSEDVELKIVAINDLTPPDSLALLTKYDSVHGKLEGNYGFHQADHDMKYCKKGDWYINCGTADYIYMHSEKDPSNIPWDKHNVDVVFECTGIFRTKDAMSKHMRGSVKKVVVSAPGEEVDTTIVMGVNDDTYDKENHHYISNASCTTNCLAPVAKAIDESLEIISGTMTTVHAYTADQRLQDTPHKDPRRARAAAMSMIPTSTGAAKAVGLVLPHLAGKLDGGAIRVPTPNVSLVDVTFQVKKETTVAEVNKILTEARNPYMKTERLPLVSCDYNGNTFSSIVDLELTKVMAGTTVKVLSWYDNEVGYSNRMLNLATILL